MGTEIDRDCEQSSTIASPLRGEGNFSARGTSARKMGEGECADKKIYRGIVFLIYIVLFLFTAHSSQLTTFAQDTNTGAENKNVRVAISDNNFKTLVYNQISIIATGEYTVYDKQNSKPIIKILPTDVLKIKYNMGKFELSVKDKVLTKDLACILVIDCPKGLLGVENLKRNGKPAFYHGVFEITPKDSNSFYLINMLNLQDYLKGVVPNEMPVRFGLEALKAQAIAARNYVLLPRVKTSRDFDVDDSVASQVYFGAKTENEISNEAVDETEGLVALYGWNLILAQYSSTAGGYTENYENAFSDPRTKEFPAKSKSYLKGRPDIYSVAPLNREEEAKIFYMSYPDSYDMKSPYYRWKKEWGANAVVNSEVNGSKSTVINDDANELNKVLQRTLVEQSKTGFIKPAFKKGDTLGEIKELKVKRRGVSGKIMELEIVTDKGSYTAYKELVIRRLLQKNNISLPSANVVFDNIYGANKKLIKVVAYGGGFGHGVGMSQYGAGFMATSLHKSFDKILKRYYTGITISTQPVILSSHESQKQITQVFNTPYKKGCLIVDNKYQIDEFNANINGKPVAFEIAKSIVPFSRITKIDISSYIRQGKNKITFYFPEKNGNKAIRLYVELVEKDTSEYNF